jgi:ribosome biogenesis protein ENP2
LTEELEETPNTNLYEDKKFVTREELEQINAESYIGTEHLEAYMHGYLMNLKLYYKLKQISEPFIYD